MRTYLLGEPVTPAMFMPAMDGTHPDLSPGTPPDAVLLLNYPPIRLFYYLFRGLAEKFNPERVDDPDGFIALAPLAMAVLAQRAGLPVEVPSPYLPENLLRDVRPRPAP